MLLTCYDHFFRICINICNVFYFGLSSAKYMLKFSRFVWWIRLWQDHSSQEDHRGPERPMGVAAEHGLILQGSERRGAHLGRAKPIQLRPSGRL